MISSVEQRRIFIWNMLGSLSTAAISVVLLMIVSRSLSAVDSDVYAFTYSFVTMMSVIGLFQVRNYQATDVTEHFSFQTYLLARFISLVMMIAATVFYVVFAGSDSYRNQVVFLMLLYRSSDVVSDLYQGLFQQKERLDIAGKSLAYRNLCVFISFLVAVLISRDLRLSLLIVSVVAYLWVLGYDVRLSRRFATLSVAEMFGRSSFLQSFSLLKESFPLFLNGFLIIYIYNQPKYVIEALLLKGEIASGAQTIYNILFMPAFVMNLLMLFFRPLITQMAIHHFAGEAKAFKGIQKRLFTYLFLGSVVVLIGSGLLGIPFLTLLYGVDVSAYWNAFMLLMLGGAVGSFATAFDNILTAMRKQSWLLIPYVGAFGVSMVITKQLVLQASLLGASFSFLITVLTWLAISTLIYFVVSRAESRRN